MTSVDEQAWARPHGVMRLGLPESVRHWGRYRSTAIAVNSDGRCGVLTYGDLDRIADQLARSLREQGAGSGAAVGLLVADKALFLAAVVGILRVGGAAVMLQPDATDTTLRLQLTDAGCAIVVTDRDRAMAQARVGEDCQVCLVAEASAWEGGEA